MGQLRRIPREASLPRVRREQQLTRGEGRGSTMPIAPTGRIMDERTRQGQRGTVTVGGKFILFLATISVTMLFAYVGCLRMGSRVATDVGGITGLRSRLTRLGRSGSTCCDRIASTISVDRVGGGTVNRLKVGCPSRSRVRACAARKGDCIERCRSISARGWRGCDFWTNSQLDAEEHEPMGGVGCDVGGGLTMLFSLILLTLINLITEVACVGTADKDGCQGRILDRTRRGCRGRALPTGEKSVCSQGKGVLTADGGICGIILSYLRIGGSRSSIRPAVGTLIRILKLSRSRVQGLLASDDAGGDRCRVMGGRVSVSSGGTFRGCRSPKSSDRLATARLGRHSEVANM